MLKKEKFIFRKKAQLLGFVIMIILLIIIAMILAFSSVTYRTTVYFGGKQNVAFQTYSTAENVRSFINNAAKWSAFYTLKTIGDRPGESVCPSAGPIVPISFQGDNGRFEQIFIDYFFMYMGNHPYQYPDFEVLSPHFNETDIKINFTNGSMIIAAFTNNNDIEIIVSDPRMYYYADSSFKINVTCEQYEAFKPALVL